MTPYETSPMIGASWLTLVMGALVVIAPFVTGATIGAWWSSILVGGLVAALAAYDIWTVRNGHAERAAGPAGVNVLAGVWLIVFPFFTLTAGAYTWINVIAGIAIAVSAGYNFARAAQMRTPARAARV